jgi:hypothetical protein
LTPVTDDGAPLARLEVRYGRGCPQQGRELGQLLGVVRLVLTDRGAQGLLVGGDELLCIAGLDGEVDAGQVGGLRAVRVGHRLGDLRLVLRGGQVR